MKKWKEVLDDSKQFPDDFKIDFGNGVTKSLGELRSEDKETHGAVTAQLTAKEQEITARAGQLSKAEAAVMEMFNNYLTISGMTAEEALAGKKPVTAKKVAENADLDENDPIVGKLVKTVNAIKADNDMLKTALAEQKEKILKPMLGTYLDDYYRDRWDEKIEPGLPKSAKGKVEFDAAMKHAEKEGYKDSRGRLDLSKAVRDLTYDFRVQEDADKRAEEKFKKMKDEDTVAAMGKPGPGGTTLRSGAPKEFKNEKGRTKSFEEVLNDARKDVEIWTQPGMGLS